MSPSTWLIFVRYLRGVGEVGNAGWEGEGLVEVEWRGLAVVGVE